ncbi:hypothetical protein [Corynebacterium sp. HS2168-gen11]|uniref:hypothetical protein n=1 Tax=Corynebacterium sp. HS2168-gen11 TaxID=2974027 RepID=UPI00216AB4AF|nr:hypothetical protein [Corynebacterium sp. HS2168-gen11]MCS4534846.1 hypothetical protein [Corynebacterium sp. HS2168-gen11]
MVAYLSGSLPGQDLVAAADVIASETGNLRTIAHLPARGLLDDAYAASLRMIPDLAVEQGPRSWRISTRPQLISRRMWDVYERDLDVYEQLWGSSNLSVCISMHGPWSIATALELQSGHRAVTDNGARNDIFEIIAGSMREHCQYLRKRFGGEVVLDLYEPALAHLIAGTVQGTSQFDTIAAIPVQNIGEKLHTLIREIDTATVVLSGERNAHLLAASIAQPAYTTVAVQSQQSVAVLDTLGALVESGVGLSWAAAALGDFVDGDRNRPRALAREIIQHYDLIGLSRQHVHQNLHVTTTRTLAGGSLLQAAHALGCARVIGEILERDAGDL